MPDGKWSDYPVVARLSAAALLWISVGEFALLIFLLLCRAYGWLWIDRLPGVVGGVMPLIVPWAGALGGLSISIAGVSRNFVKWGPGVDADQPAKDHPGFEQRLEWNVWHLTRPMVGAIFGTFAALAVVFVLGTIGVTNQGSVDVTPTGAATLAAVAFVIGYRERTFRQLIERVVDTIFGPGSGSDHNTPPSYDLTPAALDFGDVDTNKGKQLPVTIKNNGQRVLRIYDVDVSGAGFTKVSRVGNIGGGATANVDIKFFPTVPGEASGTLVVKAGGGEKTTILKGKGV